MYEAYNIVWFSQPFINGLYTYYSNMCSVATDLTKMDLRIKVLVVETVIL